ncbi:efflux RND transporter periplasmic adaptor subunit [Arundinibacter roseus]|uniref:HlyD family efflux transporter periplasmic adaptor subunit n=1 Tax=Arundinibacter roseus TaxID=2070510 RepID=A0A4R4KIM2_9BACT|nr:efflux RND transporter periplasmic adaptor subunit [Arundinibacter roseus]TDB67988.1 HlyD family efflux transporter periplasmic adaptor subunit [Arundinibacter roseus]
MARKSSNRIWWIVGGVVVVLLGGLVVAKQAGWVGQTKPTEVEFSTVKKTDIIERVSASGRVQPEVEVKLSPDVSGEITALYVEEGDSVKQGQLLLKIRPDNYESLFARAQATVNSSKASVEQSKAALAQAESRLLRAKADYDRNKKLFEDKVVSAADFEQIRANYQVAQQDIEAARANISAAQFNVKSSEAGLRDAAENLRKTTIFAPVSGVISLLNVEVGERVVGTSQMAGTELMRIANLSNMEVRVNVNENDIVRVMLGDTAEIDVDAYSGSGRKFQGVVTEIANTASGLTSATGSAAADAVTEFEVKIKILNESFQDLMNSRTKRSYPFKPGMTASVDIITDRRPNVLSVPIAAVTTRSNKTDNEPKGPTQPDTPKDKEKSVKEEPIKEVVFVDSAGVAKVREVKTGISDFENIQILSGLKEGETIVSGPFIIVSKSLKNDDKIIRKQAEVKKGAKDSKENDD